MEQKTQTDQQQDVMIAIINTKLDQILTEVKKTNGRVTTLETWKSKVQGGYFALVAVCTVLGFAIGIAATIYVK